MAAPGEPPGDSEPMVVERDVAARVCVFDGAELRWRPVDESPKQVQLSRSAQGTLRLRIGEDEVPLSQVRSVALPAATLATLTVAKEKDARSVGLLFSDEASAADFAEELGRRRTNYERFEQYEPSSVQSYFQYYAKLANQQNMLQDGVRTSTYRRAIVDNADDFRGKAAMDIGAGSGILSFFAAQAGAETVYAVEASSMAEAVRVLADANASVFPHATIEVVNKPLESITTEVQEKVDVLVSEPIGTFLFNERMIETYLCARDRYLKPGGKMFPNKGDLCIAPFSDAMLHWEQSNKNVFWKSSDFYGLDLSAAASRSAKEHFRQPIVDYINPDCLLCKCKSVRFDFNTVTIEELHEIEIPFDFEIYHPCLVHGMAGWFDALFEGSNSTVVLSTAPWCPGTHWYQIRFMLEVPLAVNAGQHIEGVLKMKANNLQSYYVSLTMGIQGTNIVATAPQIDLKDPEYRFYTSANAYCPPGTASATGAQAAAQDTSGAAAGACWTAQGATQPQQLAAAAAAHAQAAQALHSAQAAQATQVAAQAAQASAYPMQAAQANGYAMQATQANGYVNGQANGQAMQASWSPDRSLGGSKQRKKFQFPQNTARM